MAKKTQTYEVEWQTISIRTIKIFIFALIVIGSGVLGYFWLKRTNPKGPDVTDLVTPESAARFIDLEGKVEVKPKDQFVWQQATFKLDLHEDDRVKTAPDSVAKIRFDDGTEITVQPDSIVVIKRNAATDPNGNQASLVIETGESSINTEKSSGTLKVATPNIRTVKIAQGSKVDAATDQRSGQDTTEVTKGTVEITTKKGETVRLNDNQRADVDRANKVKVTELPKVPPLISPQSGQVFEFQSDQPLKIELRWRDVTDAVRYHVQIADSLLFGKIIAENPNLVKSMILIEIPKTAKKQYFWRVRSVDKAGARSPWSDPFLFVVQTPKTGINSNPGGDHNPPPLTITNIHAFFPYVQVEGKTEADAFLTINGEVIDVKDDGSFAYNYLLRKTGENILEFVAEDPAGNKTPVTKKVTY